MAKSKNKIGTNAQTLIFKIKSEYHIPYAEINANINSIIDEVFKLKWKKFIKQYPNLVLKPLFTSVSPKALNDLVDNAIKSDPTYKPFNFTTVFYGVAESKTDAKNLIANLNNSDLFEFVELKESISLPAEIYPANELNYPKQDYLNPATPIISTDKIGIDANAAWNEKDTAGNFIGDGTGIDFVDIEFGWNLNHEDLDAIRILHGASVRDISHGTSVLGIVNAKNNSKGCIGIAPNCNANTIGIEIDPVTNDELYENAIQFAITSFANPGAIILLELQTGGSQKPIEKYTLVQQIIRVATASGLVVVEAAGNGNNNLDIDVVFTDPNVDSGAIIVGAVNSTTLLRDSGTSSFGNRVNCFAWYDSVYTASGPSNSSYNYFDGTSAASAIIAGAAVVVQGIYKSKFSRALTAFQMRNLLADPTIGTLSKDHLNDKVGVMPDLKKIIYKLNNPTADIYIRDNISDNGDRHSGAISISPDIITLNNQIYPLSAVNLNYGAGSGTEQRYDLSDNVIFNQDNFIYVRVLNRSNSAIINVVAKVYYAEVATLITPNRWNYIGETTIDSVPPNNVLTVSENPIVWQRAAIPAAGHYCYVCIIESVEDPAPIANQIDLASDMDKFHDLIRNNNNITWKNFNVINVAPNFSGSLTFPFLLVGDRNKKNVFDIYFTTVLPNNAKVQFIFPAQFIEIFSKLKTKFKKIDKNAASIEWEKSNLIELKSLKFPKAFEASCQLVVSFVPETDFSKQYLISITQVHKKEIVGKITWQIKQKAKLKQLKNKIQLS